MVQVPDDLGTARLDDALGRRKPELDRGEIVRARPIEARRHPGIARIAPIGVPSARELNLDAAAQRAAAPSRTGGEKSHLGLAQFHPG